MVDENESDETSNIKVDEVDKNKCGEASGNTSDEVTNKESDEVPQVCVSTADVEQVKDEPGTLNPSKSLGTPLP